MESTTEHGTDESTTSAPLLEVRDLQKSYGAVRAVRGVSFTIDPGEVVALLGDNGAGKSTVVRCIAGLSVPNQGTFYLQGAQVTIGSPGAAKSLGIEVVHQDLKLIGSLSVAANMFLDREILHRNPVLRRLGWMNKKAMDAKSRAILDELHIRVPSVTAPVASLSGGQRQAVAVGRAVSWGRRLVLMDEPAAALGVEQSRQVLEAITHLHKQGVAVILITHNMEQAMEVCHRALVMRHGTLVGNVNIAETSGPELVGLITGGTLTHFGPSAAPANLDEGEE
jgi:simple sugar transport system ATP-binding protein